MTAPRIYYQSERVTLWLGDCLAVLPTLADGSVELMLTDPPFGVGNFVQTSGRINGRGANKGVAVVWNDRPPPQAFFDEAKRVCRDRIIWGANFFNCFEDRGGAIVWDKCQQMPNFSKADIASCTHFQKTEIVRIPWTNFTATHQAKSDHPCERPVSLYVWCLNHIGGSGVVIDTYMGSGSCGVAAIRLGRKFVGVELEERYCAIAKRRIQEAEQAFALFEPVKPETQAEMFQP